MYSTLVNWNNPPANNFKVLEKKFNIPTTLRNRQKKKMELSGQPQVMVENQRSEGKSECDIYFENICRNR